jgi:hypothetical protein
MAWIHDHSRSLNLENTMKRIILGSSVMFGLLVSGLVLADDNATTIASAESAAPAAVTANATIKAADGTVLREGSNGYTCYPQQAIIGPMCNEAVWDRLIGSMLNKESFTPDEFSVSYMLAGEGSAIGNSNSDPYATEPDKSEDWIREGAHLMIVVPDRAMLEGMSSDPSDPVYIMWGDTPYAHIMVKIDPDK